VSIERNDDDPPGVDAHDGAAASIAVFANLRLDDDDDAPVNDYDDRELLHALTDDDDLYAALNSLILLDDDDETGATQTLPDEPLVALAPFWGDLPRLDGSSDSFIGSGNDDDDTINSASVAFSTTLDELHNVFFGDNCDNIDRSTEQAAETTDALGLLEQLGNLNLLDDSDSFLLDPQHHHLDDDVDDDTSFRPDIFDLHTAVMDSYYDTKQKDDKDDDGLPSYLYCQPCSSPTEDTSGDDDEADLLFQTTAFATENTSDKDGLPPHLYCQPCSSPDNNNDNNNWNFWQPDDAFLEEYYSSSAAASPVHKALRSANHEAPIRPAAQKALQRLVEAFGGDTTPATTTTTTILDTTAPPNPKRAGRACLGHTERILGVDVSECGTFMATASQDSTVRIWNVATNALLHTLQDHLSQHECLRVAWASSAWDRTASHRNYVLATGGADGWVHLYACPDPLSSAWTLWASVDHATLSHFAPSRDDEQDRPQIYSLQFVDEWRALPGGGPVDGDGHGNAASSGSNISSSNAKNSFLLTSSDDHIHLWEIADGQKRATLEQAAAGKKIHLREVMSIQFSDIHKPGYGVSVGHVSIDTNGWRRTTPLISLAAAAADDAPSPTTTSAGYGGPRNPQNLVYVFDASYCAANDLLGAALSDGSLRILNGRGVCLLRLQLPSRGASSSRGHHLTSLAWDATGTRLATCVATGHVVTWVLDYLGNAKTTARSTTLRASCQAILQGGHDLGRPLFGTRYWGETNGDTATTGQELLLSWGVDGRVCAWDSRSQQEVYEPLAVLVEKLDFPIFAMEVRCRPNGGGVIAVAGGSSGKVGILGIPVFLYNVPDLEAGSE
jgi:WD40 repeat protein